jgi:predicted Zn-dependent protease
MEHRVKTTKVVAALLMSLLGGCYIEPYTDPVPVPANFTSQTYAPVLVIRPVDTMSTGGQSTGAQANPTTSVSTAAAVQPPAPATVSIDGRMRDQIFANAQSSIVKRFGVDSNPQLNEYLILVGSLVTMNSSTPDVEYGFVLLNTDQPVSCAIAPKTICVSRGLLKQMEDESELAGVIGREIANLISGRAMKAAGIPAPSDAATRPAGKALTASDVAIVNKLAMRLVEVLTKEGMGSEMEMAADVDGAKFAAAAKYAPDGYLRLLTRQKNASGSYSGSASGSWDRIKALDSNVQIIAKAYPNSDVRLPVRFESYVRGVK